MLGPYIPIWSTFDKSLSATVSPTPYRFVNSLGIPHGYVPIKSVWPLRWLLLALSSQNDHTMTVPAKQLHASTQHPNLENERGGVWSVLLSVHESFFPNSSCLCSLLRFCDVFLVLLAVLCFPFIVPSFPRLLHLAAFLFILPSRFSSVVDIVSSYRLSRILLCCYQHPLKAFLHRFQEILCKRTWVHICQQILNHFLLLASCFPFSFLFKA